MMGLISNLLLIAMSSSLNYGISSHECYDASYLFPPCLSYDACLYLLAHFVMFLLHLAYLNSEA